MSPELVRAGARLSCAELIRAGVTTFVVGLAVSAVHGTPRMGPAFGSMLLSGRYGAELIKKKLKNE